MESDKELAEILEIARGCGVTIHVRGTDQRPVVELLSKQNRRVGNRIVVGGIELKQRYARWKNTSNNYHNTLFAEYLKPVKTRRRFK